jgi:demethoxyubiquinone hydroxylase (CLK1/Coq7/Cat5 family)
MSTRKRAMYSETVQQELVHHAYCNNNIEEVDVTYGSMLTLEKWLTYIYKP